MLCIRFFPRGTKLKDKIAEAELLHSLIIPFVFAIVNSHYTIAGDHNVFPIVILDEFILVLKIVIEQRLYNCLGSHCSIVSPTKHSNTVLRGYKIYLASNLAKSSKFFQIIPHFAIFWSKKSLVIR